MQRVDEADPRLEPDLSVVWEELADDRVEALVTGSPALGESTDPEALRALLARYLALMAGV